MIGADSDYFPLATGNRWQYAGDSIKSRETVEVFTTERIDGTAWFRVRWFGANVLLRVDGQNRLLEYDPQSRKESVWASFSSPIGTPYETRVEPLSPNHARAVSRDAGSLRIKYDPVCCDRGILEDVYEASVGLKERTFETFAGPRTWRLISARINGVEKRF